MRGPSSSPKTAEEEAEISTGLTDAIRGNESVNRHVSCSRTGSNSSSKKEDEDNNPPIWKVGRMLMDSLSKGKMRRTKIFGAPLEDLPLNYQGMPKIAQRLCSHLEKFGLQEPGLFITCKKRGKLVERFKISFDRVGDADLENCTDVKIIASLLKLWLHDLPQPLIPHRLSSRLKTVFQKYERKEVYDLNSEMCNVLITCPALNLGVLYTVVRLLFIYVTESYPASHVDQLPEMFAKILIGDIENEHVEIITTLIHNFREIFNERILERAFKLCLVRDKKSRKDDRKRDLGLATECGNPLLPVDKLLRSNSEEKLSLQTDQNRHTSANKLNMRRVNSHEDFSGRSQHNLYRSVQVFIDDTDKENQAGTNDNTIAKCRDGDMYSNELYDEPVVDNFQRITNVSDKEAEVLVAPPPFNYSNDYQVQEEIRNAERFSPQFSSHRMFGRRKRSHQGYKVKPKLKEINDKDSLYPVRKLNESEHDFDESRKKIDSSYLESSWNTEETEIQLTSSTSSSSSSEESIPGGDEYSSPEPSQCCYDYTEPITSYRSSSSIHRYLYTTETSGKQDQYFNDDKCSKSPAVQLSNVDMKILQVNKHLQWVKKKMRRFEKDFEDKFGESPTIMNKMSHPEYKHMSATIICLKNNLKQLRKEANESFSAHRLLNNSNSNSNVSFLSSTADKEKALQEAEKQMREKRIAGERPECVDDMTVEQLQDEKVSIQKELIYLENMFGQTTARNEETFQPIYTRYRSVKRLLARLSAFSKLKEAVSDLATIMENETMDFDACPSAGGFTEGRSTPSVCQPVCNVSRRDFPISNIHELSSPELMLEYNATKEEKKKLRNRIYMYEQEAENQTMNDSKHCIHSLRCRYKNTKAKLKLLEALLVKTKEY